MRHVLAILILAAFLPGCVASEDAAEMPADDAAAAQAPQADTAAAEQAIRALEARWSQTAQARDAAAFAGFYAEDGRLMPPNGPAAEGPQAIQELMGGMLTENVSLSFQPTEIHVARSGDMAYDIGTYHMEVQTPDGAVEDDGKYLVVWKMVDGEWKAAADIFNSDKPAS